MARVKRKVESSILYFDYYVLRTLFSPASVNQFFPDSFKLFLTSSFIKLATTS